jgi:hypothetical protein
VAQGGTVVPKQWRRNLSNLRTRKTGTVVAQAGIASCESVSRLRRWTAAFVRYSPSGAALLSLPGRCELAAPRGAVPAALSVVLDVPGHDLDAHLLVQHLALFDAAATRFDGCLWFAKIPSALFLLLNRYAVETCPKRNLPSESALCMVP